MTQCSTALQETKHIINSWINTSRYSSNTLPQCSHHRSSLYHHDPSFAHNIWPLTPSASLPRRTWGWPTRSCPWWAGWGRSQSVARTACSVSSSTPGGRPWAPRRWVTHLLRPGVHLRALVSDLFFVTEAKATVVFWSHFLIIWLFVCVIVILSK